jgi:enamine deaminase RidA (YjgF/YER057c/UK114 family)
MIERHHGNNRMSTIVTFPLSGEMVVLSGLVADNAEGNVKEQTANILKKIDGFLAEVGTNKGRLTHVYIWLRDVADFQDMNSVYDNWVAKGAAPARACVEARLADPRFRVEIQAFACKQ